MYVCLCAFVRVHSSIHTHMYIGNVMRVELLWTAEPEEGFEQEDILSFRRLETLYLKPSSLAALCDCVYLKPSFLAAVP